MPFAARVAAVLPEAWLRNFVSAYEEGRVQRHPQARFVNERGECCIVGALAGARVGAEVSRSELWSRFLGTELEALSRAFESRRLSGAEFYQEAVLELTARAAGSGAPVWRGDGALAGAAR